MVWHSGKNMDFRIKQAWVLILILGPEVQFSHWKLEKNLHLSWHSTYQKMLNLPCVKYWTGWLGWKIRNMWLLLSRNKLVVQAEWQMCTQTTVVQCEHVPGCLSPVWMSIPRGMQLVLPAKGIRKELPRKELDLGKWADHQIYWVWGEKARSKGTEA